MTKVEKCEDCMGAKCNPRAWHQQGGSFGGGLYFFAFIGAAVYFIQNSTGFWMGVLGVLKAIVWPALLIFKVFGLLHM